MVRISFGNVCVFVFLALDPCQDSGGTFQALCCRRRMCTPTRTNRFKQGVPPQSWHCSLVLTFNSVGLSLSPLPPHALPHCRALLCVPRDKVLSLRNNGISACLVGGSSDLRTEEKAIAGEFPLVFVTPEKVPPYTTYRSNVVSLEFPREEIQISLTSNVSAG